MAQRPDVIVLTGDYHQGSRAQFAQQLPAIHRLFAQLHAPGGVFAVQGDVEGPSDFRRTFAGTGIRMLFNEVVRTRVGDRAVTSRWRPAGLLAPGAREFTRRFERLPGDSDVRILVAHRPDVVLGLTPAHARRPARRRPHARRPGAAAVDRTALDRLARSPRCRRGRPSRARRTARSTSAAASASSAARRLVCGSAPPPEIPIVTLR